MAPLTGWGRGSPRRRLNPVVITVWWTRGKVYVLQLFQFSFCFRQMVARTVLDTLRQVSDTLADIEAVFGIVSRLAQDVGEYSRRRGAEQM